MSHASLYARLRSNAPVDGGEILHLFPPSIVEKLRAYSRARERRWIALRRDMTFAWVGGRLPGLETAPPLLAELVARSLDYRMGPYDCLLKAENSLSVPHLIQLKPQNPVCLSVVVLLEYWKRVAPAASNLTALYRVEDRPHGWALQWREGELNCPGKRLNRFDLNRCKKKIMRVGMTLTVNSTITFAGDRNRGSFVDSVTKELSPNGIPWIWTWRNPENYYNLRYRVLPPKTRSQIINAVPMHFNTMRIQHAFEKTRTGASWLRNRREFGFDTDSFNISTYTPRLDYNEIVLLPGSQLIIEQLEVTGSLITVTLRQRELDLA